MPVFTFTPSIDSKLDSVSPVIPEEQSGRKSLPRDYVQTKNSSKKGSRLTGESKKTGSDKDRSQRNSIPFSFADEESRELRPSKEFEQKKSDELRKKKNSPEESKE